jgi:hypothetical protein
LTTLHGLFPFCLGITQAGHSELGIEERATSGLEVDIIQTWTTLGEGKYGYALLG